jgi:hypothetical protein
MMERDISLPRNHEKQGNMEVGPFRCCIRLSTTSLEVEVVHKKTVLGHCAVSVKTDGQPTVPENDWN